MVGFPLLAAVLTAAFVVRRRRSAAAERKTPADNHRDIDRRELYAQVNGHEIALGPLAQVRHLEIGSSPRVTIPVAGDKILPQHVVLRRDGEVFRLRNLSRQPITANGVTVAPRGRARVVLPLDLVLTDNIKVALQVRDQEKVEAQEVNHEEVHYE
jgi:hypothetical protein